MVFFSLVLPTRINTREEAYERRDSKIFLHSIKFSLLSENHKREKNLCYAGQFYNLSDHRLILILETFFKKGSGCFNNVWLRDAPLFLGYAFSTFLRN